MKLLIAFAPCVLCLVLAILSALKPVKAYAHRILPYLSIVSLLYLLVDIPFLYFNNYKLLIYSDIVSQFITTSVPMIVSLYLCTLRNKAMDNTTYVVSLFPSIFIGTGALVIYLLLGIDNSAEHLKALDNGYGYLYTDPLYKLSDIWCHYVYLVISFLEMMFFVVYTISIIRELPKGFKTILEYLHNKVDLPVYAVQAIHFSLIFLCYLIRIILGRHFALAHTWVAIALYLIIFALLIPIMSAGLSPVLETLTISEVLTFKKSFQRGHPTSLHSSLRYVGKESKDMSMSQVKYYHTITAVEHFIRQNKAYLDNQFDERKAADLAGVRKHEISYILASEYNCSLSDLLDGLRQTYECKGSIG